MDQCQAAFQGCGQRIVSRGKLAAQALSRFRPAGLTEVRAEFSCLTGKVEAEVDVVIRQHGQIQRLAAGLAVDAGQHFGHARRRRRGHHEPQVVGMLALVVVVDLRIGVDALRHGFDARFRNRNGGERAPAQHMRAEHGTDTGNVATRHEIAQARDHLSLGTAQCIGNGSKGLLDQRQITLPVVKQMKLEAGQRCIHDPLFHSPSRCAREVKKMPLGSAAAISPTLAKFIVS